MKPKLLTSSQILRDLKTKSSIYWQKIQHSNSIKLFREAAVRVPAYRAFLKDHRINFDLVKTWDDFTKLPPINKANYLKKYSLNELSWDGTLEEPLILTATSGSSGEPFYFTRNEKLDWQYSVLLEQYLLQGNMLKGGTSLILICFGMGIWIAGIMSYKAFEIVSRRNNFPISILTPGINKKDIFNALKKLSPLFSNTILVGYPPFIRDILDEAPFYDIDFKKLNIRLLFAAEAISEKFRDFVAEKAFVKNKYTDIMNIYGSADIGAMATENTTSILVKRLIINNKTLSHKIFTPINKTPTLAQYNPYFINFEAIEDEILLTGNNTIPLIRYSIGDQGGVLSYKNVNNILKNNNINLIEQAKKLKLSTFINELPFVYIYERADFSTSFYGLLIYPEWMKAALFEKPLDSYFTGKFTLVTKHDKQMNQILEIHLELQKEKELNRAIKLIALNKIVRHLRKNSSEYREITNQLKKKAQPNLVFWRYEDELYFKPGIKQKWVTK